MVGSAVDEVDGPAADAVRRVDWAVAVAVLPLLAEAIAVILAVIRGDAGRPIWTARPVGTIGRRLTSFEPAIASRELGQARELDSFVGRLAFGRCSAFCAHAKAVGLRPVIAASQGKPRYHQNP